jgi:hypothetical protein
MGGGLAFLNKKSWHTGSLRSVEAVWKKEQEHAKEQQKVKELQKQIEEEREKDDLHRLHESGRAGSSGKKPKTDRVEFMYNTPLANREALERDEQQEFLLGEKKVNLDALPEKAGTEAGASQSMCERVSQLPSAYTEDTPTSRNEQWQRLQNDPLFAINRQQQSALAKVRKNPVKMQAIRNEVREARRTKRKDREGDRDREGGKSSGSRSHRHHRRRHHHGSSSHKREGRRSSSHHRSSSHRHRSRSRSPRAEHSPSPRDARDARPRDSTAAATPPRTKNKSAKKSSSSSYGLLSSEAGISGTNQHSKGKFDARERIREATLAKEREERESREKNRAWGYGGKGKQKHRVGQLDEKEKQRRLEEMMGNANDQNHGRREESERKQREEDQREKDGVVSAGKETFLDTFQKNIYGADQSGDKASSLQDAIGRRKFYSQR